jgi:hypothetical protein
MLSGLCIHGEVSRLIAHEGAIKPIVQLLTTGNRQTKEKAVITLSNLSMFTINHAMIIQAGAIQPVIQLLSTGESDNTHQAAAAVLSDLATNPSNTELIHQAGAVQPLILLLSMESEQLQANAALALSNMISSYNTTISVAVTQAGAIKPLVQLLRTGSANVAASMALANLVARTPTAPELIVQEGAIKPLVNLVLLGAYPARTNAANVLLFMLCHYEQFDQLLVQDGAIHALIKLVRTLPNNSCSTAIFIKQTTLFLISSPPSSIIQQAAEQAFREWLPSFFSPNVTSQETSTPYQRALAELARHVPVGHGTAAFIAAILTPPSDISSTSPTSRLAPSCISSTPPTLVGNISAEPISPSTTPTVASNTMHTLPPVLLPSSSPSSASSAEGSLPRSPPDASPCSSNPSSFIPVISTTQPESHNHRSNFSPSSTTPALALPSSSADVKSPTSLSSTKAVHTWLVSDVLAWLSTLNLSKE